MLLLLLLLMYFRAICVSGSIAGPSQERSFQGWLTTASCRAKCSQKFLELQKSDEKCLRQQSCLQCWHRCEGFFTPYLRARYCLEHGTPVCDRGCELACKFYKRNADRPVGTVQGQEWKFPVQVSARYIGNGNLSVSWTRPRLISSRKRSRKQANSIAMVYALFLEQFDNADPKKILMTTNTKTSFSLDLDYESSKSVSLLLVAVSPRGEVARKYVDVYRPRPAVTVHRHRPASDTVESPLFGGTPIKGEPVTNTATEHIEYNGTVNTYVEKVTLLRDSYNSTRNFQTNPGLVVSTILLLLFVLCCLVALLYFICRPRLRCQSGAVSFNNSKSKLRSVSSDSTGIEEELSNMDDHTFSVKLLEGPSASQTSVQDTDPVSSHTTVTAEVHREDSPIQLDDNPSSIIFSPENRQNGEGATRSTGLFSSSSITYLQNLAFIGEELKQQFSKMLPMNSDSSYQCAQSCQPSVKLLNNLYDMPASIPLRHPDLLNNLE